MAESGGPSDSVYEDLDCNDNSPRLAQLYTQNDVTQAINPSPHQGSCPAPNYCSSASVASDYTTTTTNGQMALPSGVTYSTEDTLNNDFFFDDEFTVPFDANLVELQGNDDGSVVGSGSSGEGGTGSCGETAGLLDSAELDDIIKNRVCRSRSKRLSLLKSSSGSYRRDIEAASSSSELGDHHMSQEFTPSERDIASSSDMSDVTHHHGQIFSPQNGSVNEGSASEMNNSFLKNDHKYDFDWKATKDQYTISFDKHLAKYSSDESSFCDSTGPPESSKVLTTWATQKVNSDSECQSSSMSSRKSSDSSTAEKTCDKKQSTTQNVGGLKPAGHFEKEASDRGECSGLTTWKAVRSPSHTSDEDTSPITSWKCFKGTPHQPEPQLDRSPGTGAGQVAGKPLLRQKSNTKSVESGQSGGSSDYRTCSEGDRASRSSPESKNQRRTSLLELFQRSKSHSGTDSSQGSEHRYADHSPCEPVQVVLCDDHEGLIYDPDVLRRLADESLVSPDAMRRLTGTWSMSTISSGRRSQCAAALSPDREEKEVVEAQAPPNISLKSWGTTKNLSQLSDGGQQLFLSDSDVSVSGHSMQSGVSNGSSDKAYMPTCNCDLSGCLDCSGQQVGSGYLTDSYSFDKLNQSSQWPPCTCSTAIQTSLEYSAATGKGEGGGGSGKFRAVDISSQTPPPPSVKSDKPYSSRVSRLYSIPAVRHSPKHARDRLSHSMFSMSRNNNALPDLSFLNGNLKVTESGVLRATMSSPNLKNTKGCQTSITEHGASPNALVARRIHKRSVSTSPCSSRESSPCTANTTTNTTTTLRRPRSNSMSTNASACSSSSSGIDPGYSSCDSQITKVAHWFADVPEQLLPQIPEWLVHRIAYTERGLCLVCRAKLLQATTTTNTHNNKQHSIDSGVNSSQFNGTSQTKCDDKGMVDHEQLPSNNEQGEVLTATNGVKLRQKSGSSSSNNGTSQGEKNGGERPMSVPDMQVMMFDKPVETRKPLKSCLRRNSGDRAKVALKHRSWSDPFDATVLRYSQDGETRYQLVTAPVIKPCITGELDNQLKGCAGARDSVEFHKVCGKAPITSAATVTTNNNTAANNTTVLLPSSRVTPSLRGDSPCTSSSQSDCSGETIVEGMIKISPDRIILPACSCGTTHAVLHSSSDSGEGERGGIGGKKSVKFAERVFYHSPHNSPHQSPKRRAVATSCERYPERLVPMTREMMNKMQAECQLYENGPRSNTRDRPVVEAMSHSGTSSPSASVLLELDNIMTQKTGVVCAVIKACEVIQLQVSEAKHAAHLESLSSTRDNPSVGHLILTHLCPALVSMVTDGVKPSVRSLFGKVKNTPWRLVEELIEQGAPSRVLCNLVRDLENLAFLDTPTLKFNAFIFGLLNHRALDFWLTYLCNHEKLISNNYLPTSFVALSQTSARNLFLQLNSAIQPLGKIPFRLEYNFEYKIVKASQSQELSEPLLEKHTSSSTDAVLEHLLNLQEQQEKAVRPDAEDEELDHSGISGTIVSPSGKPSRDSTSPLRESIQDTLKQYTPSMEQTKERTKTLLKYTGQQIKDKFKQIQRQSRSGPEIGDGCGPTEAGSGVMGARLKGSGPVRVTRYEQHSQRCREEMKEDEHSQDNIHPVATITSKDDTAIIKTIKSTRDTIPRSQSLDTMPCGRNVTTAESTLQNTPKQSSLTDLVNFVGKKLLSFTTSSSSGGTPPPKPPRTYRDDITRYSFDHNDLGAVSLATSSSESCLLLSTTTNTSQQQVAVGGHHNTGSTGVGGGVSVACIKETLLKSHSLTSLQQSTTSCSSPPPNDFQVSGSNNTSVTSSTQSAAMHGPDAKTIIIPPAAATAKILSPSASMHQEQMKQPLSQSISKTASFFKRKLGPTLINVFDRLLLDKKPAESVTMMKKTQSQGLIGSTGAAEHAKVGGGVRRSRSDHEMPKKKLQALCSYVATESDELSFQKGSTLSLIRAVDSEWLVCDHKDSKGLVHRGCVQGMD